MNAPEQLPLPLINREDPIPLNRKAMLVKLTQSRPTMSSRLSTNEEQQVRELLGDGGIKATSNIFTNKDGEVRAVINAHGAIYAFHKANTLPYEDRGARLLPVGHYEQYRDGLRELIDDADTRLKAVMPRYDTLVNSDILWRNQAAQAAGKTPRASLNDYPTAEQFAAAVKTDVRFMPLPDQSHWLFDISPEDKASLDAQLSEASTRARDDLLTRMHDPLIELLEKLKIPAGQPGAIFRDSKVENVLEAVELCRKLAMNDQDVLQACDLVESSFTGYARNPQVLRDSPIVREQTVAKLNDVALKMAAFMGN